MTNPTMKKIAPWGTLILLVVFSGAALAQSSNDPAAGSGAAAGSAVTASTPPSTAPASAPAPASTQPVDARKACTDAMNANPQFAADIIATLHDQDTIKVHTDAVAHVQKNERHVIYAYAGMWILAALFVIFLWRRQQALKIEIANLRRDLDATAIESKIGGAKL